MPVIDGERRAAIAGEAPGKRTHLGDPSHRPFDHRPLAPRNGDLGHGLARKAETQRSVIGEPDQPLAPGALGAHELPKRQGVEELVGDGRWPRPRAPYRAPCARCRVPARAKACHAGGRSGRGCLEPYVPVPRREKPGARQRHAGHRASASRDQGRVR